MFRHTGILSQNEAEARPLPLSGTKRDYSTSRWSTGTKNGRRHRTNPDADDGMLIGPQPPHDLGELSRVDGNATGSRISRADVKKESRTRALHDGMTVVVDDDGMGVGRSSPVE